MVYAKDIMLRTVGELGIDGATYRAIEYHGTTVDELSITGRITMANMAIEAGAKNGIFHADEKTIAYVKERTDRPFVVERADADAVYERVVIDRCRRARAADRLPAHARQRPSDLGGHARGASRRSSLHRFVHQRLHRRPARRREDPRGQTHRVEPARHRQSRLAEGLDAGGARGHSDDARGCRLRRQHAGLRRLLRRPHGDARRRRARDLDDQPQLRRAHGLAEGRDLSGVAGDLRRLGAHRPHHRPARSLELRRGMPRSHEGTKWNQSCADTRTNTERTSTPTSSFPGKYCNIIDPAELGKHALEGLDPEYTTRMKAGRHHRRRHELRLRFEPRGRADRDQGLGNVGGHRQELRANILSQRAEHRAADLRIGRGRRRHRIGRRNRSRAGERNRPQPHARHGVSRGGVSALHALADRCRRPRTLRRAAPGSLTRSP